MSDLISSASTTNLPGVYCNSWLGDVRTSASSDDLPCHFSKVPAFLNVVDIAGLVKGAHSGQGLGNAFLSNISACDGIFHMTRELQLLHKLLQLLCSNS